jgi:hypothetical protein
MQSLSEGAHDMSLVHSIDRSTAPSERAVEAPDRDVSSS